MTDIRSIARDDRQVTDVERWQVEAWKVAHGFAPMPRAGLPAAPFKVSPRVNRWDDIANRAMGF